MEVGTYLGSNDLTQLIFNICIENSREPEARYLKITRISLKVLTFGCAIGGAVPNISVALKFGGDNLTLGIIVACANFTTRTFLGTWSYHNTIDREIGTQGRIKRQISNRKLNMAKRIALKVAVFAITFIAQTPRAYIAYLYNHQNIIFPILTYQSLVAVPAYSLDLSFTAALEVKNLSKIERSLNRIKKNLKKSIQAHRSKLIELPPNDRDALLSHLTSLDRQSRDSAVVSLFSKICTEQHLPPKAQETSQKIKTVSSTVLSGLITATTVIAQTGFYFWVGVQGSKSVWDNPVFCYAIGVLILISNLYLTTKVMSTRSKKLTKQVLNKPQQLLTGDSVSSILIPKTRATIGLAALVISALSTGTMIQAVGDYFEGKLASTLKVLVPLSMFLLGHQAISDLVDEMCQQGIAYVDHTKSTQHILKIDHLLKKFHFIIGHMSLKHFAKLLMTLPNDVLIKIVHEEITKDQLFQYINS